MTNVKTLFEGFKPEHEFTNTIPNELAAFINVLSDLGFKTDIEPSWDAEYLMNRFIESWENSREESRPDQSAYPREVFDQVGIAIKMKFAWDYLSLCLFGKNKVAHELILETANDLQCSSFLSSEGYSKQSLQILRNFYESCAGILYFQKAKQMFDDWLNDSRYYYFPDYRDMVNDLKRNGVLSIKEAKFLHDNYSELNNSVHNKRKRLNMNLTRMEQRINMFGIQDMTEWSKEIKKSVSFMMELYVRLWEINYWQVNSPSRG